jgi:hypothetical protein
MKTPHSRYHGWKLALGIPVLVILWVLVVIVTVTDGIFTAMITSPCKWLADTIAAWIVDLGRWIK